MAVPKPLVRADRALSNGLYRASGGRLMGKVHGMPVLLIKVAGRKTGDPHTTPVSYFDERWQVCRDWLGCWIGKGTSVV
jgi:F420H(2)-dependent quinone reductase